jgi:hypothetical protein
MKFRIKKVVFKAKGELDEVKYIPYQKQGCRWYGWNTLNVCWPNKYSDHGQRLRHFDTQKEARDFIEKQVMATVSITYIEEL